MKITIEKSHFTMAQAEAVQARHAEMKECLTNDEIERAAAFYAGMNPEGVYDVKAKISRHVGGLYTCEDDDYCTVDCWVDMLVETYNTIYRVGFYVLDFWQLAQGIDHSNADEVRRRAYIRKFVEV